MKSPLIKRRKAPQSFSGRHFKKRLSPPNFPAASTPGKKAPEEDDFVLSSGWGMGHHAAAH